jgi:hypothetical protein
MMPRNSAALVTCLKNSTAAALISLDAFPKNLYHSLGESYAQSH